MRACCHAWAVPPRGMLRMQAAGGLQDRSSAPPGPPPNAAPKGNRARGAGGTHAASPGQATPSGTQALRTGSRKSEEGRQQRLPLAPHAAAPSGRLLLPASPLPWLPAAPVPSFGLQNRDAAARIHGPGGAGKGAVALNADSSAVLACQGGAGRRREIAAGAPWQRGAHRDDEPTCIQGVRDKKARGGRDTGLEGPDQMDTLCAPGGPATEGAGRWGMQGAAAAGAAGAGPVGAERGWRRGGPKGGRPARPGISDRCKGSAVQGGGEYASG